MSASAAVIAAHGALARVDGEPAPAKGAPPAAPRILSLELLSAAPLAAMKEFYGGRLGLPVVAEEARRLTFAAGGTRLSFEEAGAGDGGPFYHFAFNIPENKVLGALAWQRERGPLMPVPERLRDPDYPIEVVHFRHWNAHSVFFFDPAGNVVEYIARHDLANTAGGGFGSEDILYASEIAWIVEDVASASSTLGEVLGVVPYRGGDEQFRAMGDELGLLLVMKRGRTLNFNPADPSKAARIFRTAARLRGDRPLVYRFPGLPYEISVGGG